MFDYMIVDLKILPDLTDYEINYLSTTYPNWQTKHFENQLTDVYIVEDSDTKYKHSFLGDGTKYKLQIKQFEWETVPKEERPYPDAEEGSLESILGCMRESNVRIVDLDYTGTFTFYNYVKPEGTEVGEVKKLKWVEYLGEAKNGKIISIKRLEEE